MGEVKKKKKSTRSGLFSACQMVEKDKKKEITNNSVPARDELDCCGEQNSPGGQLRYSNYTVHRECQILEM